MTDTNDTLAALEARTVSAILHSGEVHAEAFADITTAPDDAEAARRLAAWQPRMEAADAAMGALLDQLRAARKGTIAELSPWEWAARYFDPPGGQPAADPPREGG